MNGSVQYQNDRYICADCGGELEPQWGKQYRDNDEPISKTQAAYVMFCRICDAPKAQWSSPDVRDADLSKIKNAS